MTAVAIFQKLFYKLEYSIVRFCQFRNQLKSFKLQKAPAGDFLTEALNQMPSALSLSAALELGSLIVYCLQAMLMTFLKASKQYFTPQKF